MTRLLGSRVRGADDSEVLSAIEGIKAKRANAAAGGRAARVGIANECGEIYRVVELVDSFELLELTARLNALGFRVDEQARARRFVSYARILSRDTSSVVRKRIGG